MCSASDARAAPIEVRNLTMAYGSNVVMRDLAFTVGRGDIFVIMGGSGCGKSTLLRHLVGLQAPARGVEGAAQAHAGQDVERLLVPRARVADAVGRHQR